MVGIPGELTNEWMNNLNKRNKQVYKHIFKLSNIFFPLFRLPVIIVMFSYAEHYVYKDVKKSVLSKGAVREGRETETPSDGNISVVDTMICFLR